MRIFLKNLALSVFADYWLSGVFQGLKVPVCKKIPSQENNSANENNIPTIWVPVPNTGNKGQDLVTFT